MRGFYARYECLRIVSRVIPHEFYECARPIGRIRKFVNGVISRCVFDVVLRMKIDTNLER
jgi:hypothetical protein